MPIDYSLYPGNWLSEIRPRILARDGHCCKFCGIADRLEGWRVPSGKFYTWADWESNYIAPGDEKALAKKMKKRPKPYEIVLTVAHLDHKLIDHSDENLAALCQRCHLNYDRQTTARQRAQSRRYSRRKKQLHLDFLSDICPPHLSSTLAGRPNSAGSEQHSKKSRMSPVSGPF